MKTFVVDRAWDGRKLVRFLMKIMPSAGMTGAKTSLRRGNVRLDGKHPGEEAVLKAGQTVAVYEPDAAFEAVRTPDPFFSKIRPKLTILYEDEHYLVLDKRSGLVCHPDEGEKVNTLLTWVQAYLYQKGAWTPGEGFAPALCNRIDRFTAGIVIAAKDEKALRTMNEKIRTHEVQKYYLCIVLGHLRYPDGTLRHELLKPEGAKKVQILKKAVPGSKEAITHYQVCDEQGGLSLVECLLGTGRTHQIRAQFAAIGHPLLGDNQYGDAKANARYEKINGQALCAYRLIFEFEDCDPILEPLNHRLFQVRSVPFIKPYFPEVEIPQG